jgi:hypothetical protein
MVVVIRMSTGTAHRVDRNERLDAIAKRINAARGLGQLIELRNDATPSRSFYIDPADVESVTDDGHSY